MLGQDLFAKDPCAYLGHSHWQLQTPEEEIRKAGRLMQERVVQYHISQKKKEGSLERTEGDNALESWLEWDNLNLDYTPGKEKLAKMDKIKTEGPSSQEDAQRLITEIKGRVIEAIFTREEARKTQERWPQDPAGRAPKAIEEPKKGTGLGQGLQNTLMVRANASPRKTTMATQTMSCLDSSQEMATTGQQQDCQQAKRETSARHWQGTRMKPCDTCKHQEEQRSS